MSLEEAQFISSNIQSATWDPDSRELNITFLRNGSVYTFDGVPREVWEQFKIAPSAGRYFREYIQDHYG